MQKQFKEEDQPIKPYLYTERLCTNEFSPLVNEGEFVLLDIDMRAKKGDLVGIKSKEPPFFKLAFYENNLDYFAVAAGVGRRLNKMVFQ